jgi:hypothetical protein
MPHQVPIDSLLRPSKATMGVVHPHICTVEISYHESGKKAADDVLVISYHNQGDKPAADALLVPSYGLEFQPANHVLGVAGQDPKPLSANTPPFLCHPPRDNCAGDVSVDGTIAVPSNDPGHQHAGVAFQIPEKPSEDQSTADAAFIPTSYPGYGDAGEINSIPSHGPGNQSAEILLVAPIHDSEDGPVNPPRLHDPEPQLADVALLDPDHQPEAHISTNRVQIAVLDPQDEPADDASMGPYYGPKSPFADEILVVSNQIRECQPVREAFHVSDQDSENKPTKEASVGLFHEPGLHAPGQAVIISHDDSEVRPTDDVAKKFYDNSGDEPKDNAFLISTHGPGYKPPDDALSTPGHECNHEPAGNTSWVMSHNSEHKLEEAALVSNNSERKHKEEDSTLLGTFKFAKNNHTDESLLSPYASDQKVRDRNVLTPYHDSESNRVNGPVLSRDAEGHGYDDALWSPAQGAGDRPADDVLLMTSHGSGDQPVHGNLLTFSHDPKDQRAHDALVVSPYTAPSHLLRLHTVSKPNQLLAKALTHMMAVRDDYATAPYIESFNWPTVIKALNEIAREEAYEWQPEIFYIVVFRSRVRAVTNRVDLGLMDAKAHEEAMESGGLLKYWFGEPDANLRNLATCKCPRTPSWVNHV